MDTTGRTPDHLPHELRGEAHAAVRGGLTFFRKAKQLLCGHPLAMLVLFLVFLNYLDDGEPAVRESNGSNFANRWIRRKKLAVLSDTVRPDDGRRIIHLAAGDDILKKMVDFYATHASVFPLHLAAYHGDTERLAKLLSLEKTGPNEKGMNWETPLHVAVKFSKLEALQLLVASGSDPDRRATTIYPYGPGLLSTLHYAVLYSNNTDAAKLLLKAGADAYATPSALRFACKEGRADIANLILDEQPPGQGLGQDRNSLLFSVAAGFGWTKDPAAQMRLLRRLLEMDPSMAKTLNTWGPQTEILRNQAGLTIAQYGEALKQPRPRIAPLHALAMLPRNASVIAEAMQIMLDHGADVNILTSEGYSALNLLAQRCELNIFEPAQVLDVGANVKALLGWRESKCRRGYGFLGGP
ncbi:hypothetical protein HDU89_008642 [Geranomyces variabilis]|nr:hypothetical protein HDU89_008642 [Geranomyces variabilis]